MNETQALPKNVELERACIGCMLLKGIKGELFRLQAEDFSDLLLRDAWVAARSLDAQEIALDQLTVSTEMAALGEVSQFEAFNVLTAAVAEVDTTAHADDYAKLLMGVTARRKLALAAPAIYRIAVGDGKWEAGAVFAAAEAVLRDAAKNMPEVEREQWTFAELAALEPKADPFLVGHVIVDEGLNLLAGQVGAGKTWLALDVALGMASRTTAWGMGCQHGRVLYLGADNTRETIRKRIVELCKARGMPAPESVKVDLSPLNIGDENGIAQLRSLIQEHSARLVIIDCWARYVSGIDENSAADVGQVMASLRDVVRRTGATVLVLHHLRKGRGEPTVDDLPDRIRGSIDLLASMDSALVLTKEGSGPTISRQLSHVKCRDAEETAPISMCIEEGERGGLVLAFESLAFDKMSKPLAEVLASLMLEVLQQHGGAWSTSTLRSAVEETGMKASDRMWKYATNFLATLPGITKARQGRQNTYSWTPKKDGTE